MSEFIDISLIDVSFVCAREVPNLTMLHFKYANSNSMENLTNLESLGTFHCWYKNSLGGAVRPGE